MLREGLEPLPGHHLTHKLGQGGFGEVWAATAPDGSPLALKFINCQDKPGSVIAHEIRMMRSLQNVRHPYFIRLHGVCTSPPYIIIIMERADGSLKDLHAVYEHETGRNIPVDHLLELLEQAAEALDYLATVKLQGFSWIDGCVQHCDVKPSNLLVIGDTLKVADFGLCASAKSEAVGRGFRGTPPYAPPELYEGRASSRTDQYSLAITFCDLCIGQRVFVKSRPLENTTACQGSPIDLAKLRDREFPVLAKALSERWTDRWPSCRDFISALKRAARGSQKVHRLPAVAVPQR